MTTQQAAPGLLDRRAARRRARRIIAAAWRARLKPPPRLTVSEWADRYRIVSRGTSPEPGRWRTSRVPYLRAILDACSDPMIERVVVMSSSQVGKTELINNLVGFFIDQDPAPILVVQPTVDDARTWSKERLAPMLRDTPRLRDKVRDPRARDSGNTIREKQFPGGSIAVVGANSASGLSARPRRVVLFDEVDRYPASAGSEGDPVSLGIQRTSNFWNRVVILVSTPTIKDVSRIEKEFKKSDQRHHYVPCPHCEHMRVLRWPHLRWDKDVEGGPIADSVAYLCESCGVLIDESEKYEMLACGRWVAENPGSRVAGFHINALYSPWTSWAKLAQQWHDAQGSDELLQAFINLKLGVPWEERGERVDKAALAARRETYAAEVPAGSGILTAGVDVQGDRLEVAVKGWGAGEESWLIAHHRIWGDPETDEPWDALDGILFRAYAHELGGTLRIRAAMIDSGHKAVAVYNYVRPRQRRGVYASKGVDERRRALLSRPQRANRHGVKLFSISTIAAKDRVFGRLKRTVIGPGYVHFPQAAKDGGADDAYLEQFGAEKAIVTRKRSGYYHREYIAVAERNEAIDLEVLNLAALYSLGAGVVEHLDTYVKRAAAEGKKAQAEASENREETARAQPPVPPKRSGFVNRWR